MQTEKSGTLGSSNDQTIFQPKAYGISAFESNAMKSSNPHSGIYEAETARTLDLNGGNPACNQGGICVVEPVAADLYNATLTGDTAATVTARTGQYGGASGPSGLEPCGWDGGQVSPTITKQNAGGNQRRPDKDNFNCVLVYSQQRFGEYAPAAAAAALRAAGGDYGGGSENLASMRYAVRRLTPLECERMQGVPDGWTDIGDYTDSKGKKRKTSDSARYKALGNSIALPFWQWMLRRMCEISGARTMGSLFDGIGGFPLCWERINGAGSCRWASEIEEFPMAVTKRHFKEE